MTYPKEQSNAPNLRSWSVPGQDESESDCRGKTPPPFDKTDQRPPTASGPDDEWRAPDMIDAIEFKHFRCFKRATVNGCKKINLIVGENGAGKTAFLEGLFLAAAPGIEVALRNRTFRGYENEKYIGTPQQVDHALWGDLFYNFDIGRQAYIGLKGYRNYDHNDTRSVTIAIDDSVRSIPQRIVKGIPIPRQEAPVLFTWKAPHGFVFKANPVIQDGVIKSAQPPDSNIRASFYSANRIYPSYESANKFSELSRTFQSDRFKKIFKDHFDSIEDLSIEYVSGSAMLYAKVAHLSERIPVNLASGGMNKLAALLLNFPTSPNGIIIIDEIENGLYFKRIPHVWKSLYDLAVEYDVQLFVSTHSGECLDAAARLAAEHPDDFKFMRMVSGKDGAKIRQFDGASFANAVSEKVEVR